MDYRYKLPGKFIEPATTFKEFANGGAQATIKLKDGRIFEKALISNSQAIIAMRGYTDLPFCMNEIEAIYQTSTDIRPEQRDNWQFWDKW